MPSTKLWLFAAWKATTSAAVFGPYTPSTLSFAPFLFKVYCMYLTYEFFTVIAVVLAVVDAPDVVEEEESTTEGIVSVIAS